jgi:hypothetical protein
MSCTMSRTLPASALVCDAHHGFRTVALLATIGMQPLMERAAAHHRRRLAYPAPGLGRAHLVTEAPQHRAAEQLSYVNLREHHLQHATAR